MGEGIFKPIADALNRLGRVLNNVRGLNGINVFINGEELRLEGRPGGAIRFSGNVYLFGKLVGFSDEQKETGLKRYMDLNRDTGELTTVDVMPDPWPPNRVFRDISQCAGDIYID